MFNVQQHFKKQTKQKLIIFIVRANKHLLNFCFICSSYRRKRRLYVQTIVLCVVKTLFFLLISRRDIEWKFSFLFFAAKNIYLKCHVTLRLRL